MKKSAMLQTIKKWAAVSLMVSMMVSPSAAAQAAYAVQETVVEVREEWFTEPLSYVSFPARFEDSFPDSGQDRYYLFQIDSRCDLSVSLEYENGFARYGLELLDSSQNQLGISDQVYSQRILEPDVAPGAYFLRVFPIGDSDYSGSFRVSIAKTDLSEENIKTVDFSELHMLASLQAYGSPYFLNGYSVNYYFDWNAMAFVELDTPRYLGAGVNSGGIYPMPQHYYRSWIGPVADDVLSMKDIRALRPDETSEEYEKYLVQSGLRYREGGNPLIHVQDAIALPMRFEALDWGEEEENEGWMEHLKNAVMTYGAATTGGYWNFMAPCEDEQNYYCSGYEYRWNDEESVFDIVNLFEDSPYASASNLMENHEVDIVGWDDNYPRENFRYRDLNQLATGSDLDSLADDRYLPEGDGAWIVRNSWGTNLGDEGYYYVSYYDKRLVSANNSWVFSSAEARDNYNKLYMTAMAVSGFTNWVDCTAVSNVFTAEGNDVLRAVSFELLNNSAEYQIGINRGADIGKGLLEENIYASGYKKYAGDYTVRLNKPILLEQGEAFEVVLGLALDDEDDSELAFSVMSNNQRQGNIPSQPGLSYSYGPFGREDIGRAGEEWYGYATLIALCYDASLEEGEVERVTVFDLDPDQYYNLLATSSNTQKAESGLFAGNRKQRASVGETAAYDGNILDEDGMSDEWIDDEDGMLSKASDSDAEVATDSNTKPGRHTVGYDGFTGKRQIIRTLPNAGSRMKGEPRAVEADLPERFDLREEGVLTPVKNQENTNSCWAFGSTAAAESGFLMGGSNLFNYNYASGVKVGTKLPVMQDGRILYRFDKGNPESMKQAVFDSRLLSWDGGPLVNMGASLLWEFSGDLHAIDFVGTDFEGQSGVGKFSTSGEETLILIPKDSGMITVRVSSEDDPTKAAVFEIVLMEENRVKRVTVEPEYMNLRVGAFQTLNVKVDAEDGVEIKPVFTSDQPSIASVDDRGNVIGLNRGTTKIRVRAGDKEAVCTVTVTRDNSSSSGSDRRLTVAERFPGAQEGDWTMHEDGSWRFRVDEKDYKDVWGYLYNPYGNGGVGDAGWYRFDDEGKMITGWFTDLDGNVYYMNPVSDGNRGKMCTGWTVVKDEYGQERSFYFSEVSGGPLGSLVRDMNGAMPK